MSEAAAHLDLGGRKFAVRQAKISGWLNALPQTYAVGLGWTVEVECEGVEYDDEWWEPRSYCEFFHLPVRSWRALEGQAVTWNGDVPVSEGPRALYLWEHGTMARGDLSIGRREGTLFDLRWTGLADVHFDGAFGADVPFDVACQAQFTDIRVLAPGVLDGSALRSLLSAELDLSGLSLTEVQQQPSHRVKAAKGLLGGLFGRDRHPTLNTLATFRPADA